MLNRKGFTLVELLVVIAIISLLISILAPSLNIAKDIAKQVVCASDMNSAGKGMLMYGAGNDDKYPPYRMRMSKGQPAFDPYTNIENTMWAGKVGDLNPVTLKQIYRGLGIMYGTKDIENPRYFYCPAQKFPWFAYDEYLINRRVTPNVTVEWGTIDNYSSMIRIGYLHNAWGKLYPNEGSGGQWDIAFRSFSQMEPDKALMIDHAIFPWCAAVHTATGIATPTFNIMHPDGHVESPRTTVGMIVMFSGAAAPMNGVGDICKSWGENPGTPENGPDDWNDLYTLLNEGL